jgi:two-component system response regulator NreC
MSKIKILLAEDHAVVRAGLRALLSTQPDMEVVGEAGEGREVVDQALKLLPDIVLLDLSMPGLDGLGVLHQLKKKEPRIKVLVLTVHEEEQYLLRVLEAGGAGYVVKRAADTELIEALRAVHRGESFVHPSVTKKLVEAYLRQATSKEKKIQDALTEREKEVLKLIALGYTNQEIADYLVIGMRTVETHRAHIMEKLKLRKRAELVKYALSSGLLQEQEIN